MTRGTVSHGYPNTTLAKCQETICYFYEYVVRRLLRSPGSSVIHGCVRYTPGKPRTADVFSGAYTFLYNISEADLHTRESS